MASKYTRYTDPKFKKNFLNPQNRDSLYFNNDYEEPTYLGFKIEFGDWGASLLSESVMRSQSSYLSNSVSMDYDAFPCGLMDLNFVNNPSDTINMFSSANTDAAYYNAVNYLYSKNEDQRALYLKAFIQGMYEIQREYPQMFQKISGVDKLLEFNSTSGQRIAKDTKITIGCLDFLDQRLRTLFNLYRKAAWDDVWQRWVLPDIYRSFKMIIYISEYRSFQKPINNNSKSFLSKILNLQKTKTAETGLIELDLDYDTSTSSYTDETSVENMLPVYAFECSPCEFEIPKIFTTGDFETYSTTPAEFSFEVTVKNVKTFQANNLMNKLGIIAIGDLLSTKTASSGSYTINSSVNESISLQDPRSNYSVSSIEQYRYMWLKHPFFTSDILNSKIENVHNYEKYNNNFSSSKEEIYNQFNENYITTGLAKSGILINAIGRSNSFVRLITDLIFKTTGLDKLTIINRFNNTALSNRIKNAIDNNFKYITLIDDNNQNSFYDVSVSPFKVKTGFLNVDATLEGDIIKNIIDVSINSIYNQNEGYKQLLDAAQYLKNNYNLVKQNMLNYLNELKNNLIHNSEYLDNINQLINNDKSWATDLDGGPVSSSSDMTSIIKDISIDKQNMQEIVDNVSIKKEKITTKLNDNIIIKKQGMTEIVDNSSKPDFEYLNIIDDISLGKEQMPGIIDDSSKVDQEMNSIISDVSSNTDFNSVELVSNTSLLDLDMSSLINDISVNKNKDMLNIISDVSLPKSSMTSIKNDISINHEINDVSIQSLTTNNNKDLLKVNYSSLNSSLNDMNINNNLISNSSIILNSSLPNLTLTSLNNNIKLKNEINNLDLQDLSVNKKQISELNFDNLNNSINSNDLNKVFIEDNLSELNKAKIPELEKPKYQKEEFNKVSIEDNLSELNKAKIPELEKPKYQKAEFNKVSIEDNEHENKSQMTSIKDVSTEKETEIQLELPDYKIPSNKTELDKISFSQLATMTNDLEVANIQLTDIINNKIDKNPQINVPKLETIKDRSLATDLDGGPETKSEDMVRPDKRSQKEKKRFFSTATQSRNIKI